MCTYYEIKYVKNDSGFVCLCALALMTMNFISLSHNPNRWSSSDHCTLCAQSVCVCLNYVIWANLLDSAQKFIMCPKSTFLVGARNHAKRQWILKSGIFTKKTGGGIWPTWYLSHYSITPGRYFSIGQIYWSKYLVWTAVICRDLFFKIKDLFVLHIEKLVMNGPSQRSLTLMQ